MTTPDPALIAATRLAIEQARRKRQEARDHLRDELVTAKAAPVVAAEKPTPPPNEYAEQARKALAKESA